jgi:dihydroxyacetone kinase
MLSAAVLGNVFASPSVAAILAALRVCAGSKGSAYFTVYILTYSSMSYSNELSVSVLLVVKNYTGDR